MMALETFKEEGRGEALSLRYSDLTSKKKEN